MHFVAVVWLDENDNRIDDLMTVFSVSLTFIIFVLRTMLSVLLYFSIVCPNTVWVSPFNFAMHIKLQWIFFCLEKKICTYRQGHIQLECTLNRITRSHLKRPEAQLIGWCVAGWFSVCLAVVKWQEILF